MTYIFPKRKLNIPTIRYYPYKLTYVPIKGDKCTHTERQSNQSTDEMIAIKILPPAEGLSCFTFLRKVFSPKKQIFGLTKQVFCPRKQVFGLTKQVFGLTNQVFGLTNQVFAGKMGIQHDDNMKLDMFTKKWQRMILKMIFGFH